jgi:hypothetical protein
LYALEYLAHRGIEVEIGALSEAKHGHRHRYLPGAVETERKILPHGTSWCSETFHDSRVVLAIHHEDLRPSERAGIDQITGSSGFSGD